MSEFSEAVALPEPTSSEATSSDAEPGGADAGREGTPAGFTAHLPVSGGAPGMTDDPEAARAAAAPEHEDGDGHEHDATPGQDPAER